MNTHPQPPVPGDTEWERFDNAVRKALTVPKEAFLEEQARRKKVRTQEQAEDEKPG